MNTRITYFRSKLSAFGVIPLVLAQNIFEKMEEYENCAAIRDVLKEREEMGVKIPTFTSVEHLRNCYKEEFYDFGLSGETAALNLQSYVEVIVNCAPY
jgi:hypothetical protein